MYRLFFNILAVLFNARSETGNKLVDVGTFPPAPSSVSNHLVVHLVPVSSEARQVTRHDSITEFWGRGIFFLP